MSASLGESLGALIRTQPDMDVVADDMAGAGMLDLIRARRADVIIVQDGQPPEPIASLIAGQTLGVVVIERDGRSGALTRITADRSLLSTMSAPSLIDAVRAAMPGGAG